MALPKPTLSEFQFGGLMSVLRAPSFSPKWAWTAADAALRDATLRQALVFTTLTSQAQLRLGEGDHEGEFYTSMESFLVHISWRRLEEVVDRASSQSDAGRGLRRAFDYVSVLVNIRFGDGLGGAV